MNTTFEIQGQPYNSEQPPSEKIAHFLRSLDREIARFEGTSVWVGLHHAKGMAEIWFAEEVEVIKVRQQ
jgi:hypothetical protein